MIRIIYPFAVQQKLQERGINKEEASDVIQHPDQVLIGKKERKISQKRIFDRSRNKEYLIRIIFEARMNQIVVVTGYKTSKIQKYWKEVKK